MTLGELFPLEVEAFINGAFHGIDLNQIFHKHLESVPTLMQYSQFTTDMLEAALGNSIPIDLSCSCFGEKDLLVVAMAVDRPDLASVAFLQGIRIPHGQRDLLLIDEQWLGHIDQLSTQLSLLQMIRQHAILHLAEDRALLDVFRGVIFPILFQLLKAHFAQDIFEVQSDN